MMQTEKNTQKNNTDHSEQIIIMAQPISSAQLPAQSTYKNMCRMVEFRFQFQFMFQFSSSSCSFCDK